MAWHRVGHAYSTPLVGPHAQTSRDEVVPRTFRRTKRGSIAVTEVAQMHLVNCRRLRCVGAAQGGWDGARGAETTLILAPGVAFLVSAKQQ